MIKSNSDDAKPKIKEVIVVEGAYDKQKVLEAVDATVVVTRGFAIFRNKKALDLLRRLAEARGLIVFTDPDRAGFLIRGFIKSAIGRGFIRHAYIPSIYGKERRKARPSREGLIGVEGARRDIILSALMAAGASQNEGRAAITKADLYGDGLCGGAQSALLRKRLAARLGLPERLGANGLLDALNAICTKAEYKKLLLEIKGEDKRLP